jgi:cell division protein WhiA
MPEKTLSFARKIKEELATNTYTIQEKKFILSGFVRNGGIISGGLFGKKTKLELHTEDGLIAKFIYASLKECYNLNPEFRYEKVTRFGRGLVYLIDAEDDGINAMMEDLEILQDGYFRVPPKEGLLRKNLKALLVGCFLANGSVNNPNSSKTSYFAEMAFSDKNDALAIKHKLDTFKDERTMNFKYILRRDKHVLYLKKSDQIAVFLSYLGATESMFEFENARMMKDDSNTINRLNICDAANYTRTRETCQKDLNAIEAYLKMRKLEFLDEKTKAVIEARRKLTEANYREIAEYINEHDGIAITKSGVVHILRNIRDSVTSGEETKKTK